MIKVTIIILSYNTKELIRNCLVSVFEASKEISGVEVIVVDNGSSDGSVEVAKKAKGETQNVDIKIIENKYNLGFAGGNNQAARLAKGEYLFFLNSDTIVDKDSLKYLLDFVKGEEAKAVSPLILNPDGSIQKDPCYLNFPSPIFCFFYYNGFLRKLTKQLFPKIIYSTTNYDSVGEISQLSGAALFISKKTFLSIGGFDEKFNHFFEDVDLSWRLKNKGYKFLLVPCSKIIHLGGKSLEPELKKEGIEKKYFLNLNSLFKFCGKNFPLHETITVKLIVFFQLLLGLKLKLINNLFFKEEP